MKRIGRELTKCSICGRLHEVDLWEEPVTMLMNGKIYRFKEMSYTCPDTKNSAKFANTELIRRNLRRMKTSEK